MKLRFLLILLYKSIQTTYQLDLFPNVVYKIQL